MQIIMKLWQNFWSGDYRFWKIFFLKLFSFVYWTFSLKKKPSTKSAFYHERKMVSKICCTKNVLYWWFLVWLRKMVSLWLKATECTSLYGKNMKKDQLTLCSIPLVRHLNERIIKRIYLYGDVIICDVWNTSHSEISYIKSHFACKLL